MNWRRAPRIRSGAGCVADAVEALGQDVEEETADELVRRETHELLAGATIGAVVLPAEGDGLGVGGDEPAVRDGDAVGIAAEIGEDRFRPAEGSLGVDHPFGLA